MSVAVLAAVKLSGRLKICPGGQGPDVSAIVKHAYLATAKTKMYKTIYMYTQFIAHLMIFVVVRQMPMAIATATRQKELTGCWARTFGVMLMTGLFWVVEIIKQCTFWYTLKINSKKSHFACNALNSTLTLHSPSPSSFNTSSLPLTQGPFVYCA